MGQDLRCMQQIIGNLQNQQLISPSQAQHFYRDYKPDQNSTCIKSTNPINPNLKEFLLYYILNKYKQKDMGKDRRDQGGGGLGEPMPVKIGEGIRKKDQKELRDRVAKFFQDSQKFVVDGLNLLCQESLTGRGYMWVTVLGRMIRKSLMIDQFSISKFEAGRTVTYDSQLDTISYTTNQKNSLEPSLSFSTGTQTFYLYTSQQKNYFSALQDTRLFQILQNCLKSYLQLCQNLKPSSSHLSILRDSCQLGLNLITVGIWVRNFMQKDRLARDFGVLQPQSQGQEQEQELDVFGVLVGGNQGRDGRVLSQEYMGHLQLPYKRLESLQESVQKCQSLLQSNSQFLYFNRYSQLKFCILPQSSPLLKKIHQCWHQSRHKIIDILSQHQSLLNHLHTHTIYTPDIPLQISGSLYGLKWEATVLISQISIFDGLVVRFRGKQQRETGEGGAGRRGEEFGVGGGREMTIVQERLVKDLLKDDPNLKQDGWLKLFIKQPTPKPQTPTLKRKPSRWSFSQLDPTSQPSQYPPHPSPKIFSQVSQILNSTCLLQSETQLKHKILKICKKNSFFIFLSDQTDRHSQKQFVQFVNQVQFMSNCGRNRFHSFFLAAEVITMCDILSNTSNAQDWLQNKGESLGTLISGLCSSIMHTGFTNKYQISTFSQLAILYNDISPLQNYQAYKTMQLLKKNNFLEVLSRDKQNQIKENIIYNMINTDPLSRGDVVSKFQAWRKMSQESAGLQINSLTAMIVHLSHQSPFLKSTPQAKQWCFLLSQQLSVQCQHENKLKITGKSQEIGATLRSFFTDMETTLLPMFMAFSQFCAGQEDDWIQEIVNNFKNNVKDGGAGVLTHHQADGYKDKDQVREIEDLRDVYD